MRYKAVRKVIENMPLVHIGRPPCTDWSTVMKLKLNEMDPATVADPKRIAPVHLEFCAKLHRLQHEAGRYFLL